MATVVLILAVLMVPALLGRLFVRRRPYWTRFRTVTWAAAPVPIAIAIWILLLAAQTLVEPSEDWGVGMALISVLPGLAVALVLYLIGLGLAVSAIHFAKRGVDGGVKGSDDQPK